MTNITQLTVTRRDERSSYDPCVNPDGVRFGFIEFDDGSRVGYDSKEGVWHAIDSWGKTGTRHLIEARRYLDKDEPGWYRPEDR